MTKRAAISLVIAAFFALTLYTTNGCGGTSPTSPPLKFSSLAGIVSDARSGAPIANARVAWNQGGSFNIQTNADGGYNITGLSPGSVRIDVTAPGYQAFSMTVTLNEGANTLNVRLTPN